MPLRRNSKRALWRRNSTSGSSSDKCHLSGTFLYMILQNFQKNRSTRGLVICDSTFSIPTFRPKPTLPTAQWHSAVCGPSVTLFMFVSCYVFDLLIPVDNVHRLFLCLNVKARRVAFFLVDFVHLRGEAPTRGKSNLAKVASNALSRSSHPKTHV